MSTKRLLVHCYFSLVLLGYATSILLQMFVSDSGFIFGFGAFVLTFVAGWVAQRKREEFSKMEHSRIWLVIIPLFIVLFLVMVVLSGSRGAPASEGLPILATRTVYNFSRAKNVEAWRYLAVSVSFAVLWHSFGATIAIDLWRHWLSKFSRGVNDDCPTRP